MTARKPQHPLIPADRVSGTTVINKAGDKLGRIEDIAIEKVSGEVAYAILSFGGMLGLGAKYHPVPWRLLKYDAERRAYVIPLSKKALETAPMIDARQLSGWTDEASREAIFEYYSHYGAGPYWL